MAEQSNQQPRRAHPVDEQSKISADPPPVITKPADSGDVETRQGKVTSDPPPVVPVKKSE